MIFLKIARVIVLNLFCSVFVLFLSFFFLLSPRRIVNGGSYNRSILRSRSEMFFVGEAQDDGRRGRIRLPRRSTQHVWEKARSPSNQINDMKPVDKHGHQLKSRRGLCSQKHSACCP